MTTRSQTCRQRTESFAAEIEENHSEMTVTEIYYMDKLDEVKEKIARERAGLPEAAPEDGELSEDTADEAAVLEEAYEYIFEKNPDINGIFASNGQAAMQMVNLCGKLGKEDTVIIGYDSDAEEIEALTDGKITGLIVQNPYGMGYAAIVAEARCILELGNEAEIDTGYTWVTADNIDSKDIQRMLYTK